MNSPFPAPPQNGKPCVYDGPLSPVAQFLALRRSAGKAALDAPGPEGAVLADLLRVAARVSDHRRVGPWRFITVAGDSRGRLGEAIAARFAALNPTATPAQLEEAHALALRAPLIVFVVSAPVPDHDTPVWEQELSAGAVCHQLCLSANAAGFGAVWLTEWISYDAEILALLGVKPGERLAGQILIGTPKFPSPERPRPDLESRVTAWTGV